VWPWAGMREFLLSHFVAVSSADHGAARAAGSASSRNERGAYGDAVTSASPAEAAIVPRLAGVGRQLRSACPSSSFPRLQFLGRRQVQNQNPGHHSLELVHAAPFSRSLCAVVTELFPARGQPHPLWPSHWKGCSATASCLHSQCLHREWLVVVVEPAFLGVTDD
jgi:hypothetical protein